jgi:transcriptional regulator of met regulon
MPIRETIKAGIAFLLLLSAFGTQAQEVVSDRIVPDTVVTLQQYEKSNRFYEHLREKTESSRLARALYRALVSEDSRLMTDTLPVDATLQKEINDYLPFEGQRIHSVSILRNNIYDDSYSRRDLRNLANYLHVVTRENKIRRYLLFKEGDRLSAHVLAQNEQLLRALDFLSAVNIMVINRPGGESVDVHVITRDSWSIGATVHSAPMSRKSVELYDSNILGSGNRLNFSTYVNYKGDLYGGNMIDYRASNLWGSFFTLDAAAGKGYEEHRVGLQIEKKFILPTDFIAGGVAADRKVYEWQVTRDTQLLIHSRDFDSWVGKSWAFPLVKGSFYLSGRFRDITFRQRPEVTPLLNPYYHSHRILFINTGLYRETYYKGNMIYEYGAIENIPYGHKFEFTTGRYWGEFHDRWYSAFSSSMGKQSRIGYYSLGATVSTYWDENGKPVQSALAFDFNGFSNRWNFSRNYFRQFISVRYLTGYNRLQGEGEQLIFSEDANLLGLRRDGNMGSVRLVANTETVMFTPIYFYGFRFVFFGYADFGWLGDNNNPFHNDFYTAFGLGVRFKNERLIFSTIQLRLGLALKNGDLASYRNFRYSGQRRLEVPRFRAERPEPFWFR